MAAGKVNVSRRGDLSHLSKRPSDWSAGSYSVESTQGGGLGSKDRSGSSCKGKNGVGLEFEVKRRSRDGGVFFGGARVDDAIGVPSPEKKRKFSSAVDESPDDHEPGQLDEEDFGNARNIFTSRWAYDDDEHDDIDNKKGGAFVKQEELKGRRSSPESGLTQKEESDGSGNRSSPNGFSKSAVDNDASMEIDYREDDDYISDESDMDYSDGSKAGVSGQGRNMLQACRSVYEYERLGKINEGSYGIVYKARDKKTGEMVALKKLKLGDEREGFPVHYLREINTLMSINHPSVVNVREVVVDDSVDVFGSIYLVMDYVEHDLKALMQARKQRFSQCEVKCLMLQLLEGVQYLHDNWVLHRDLKTSNLLLNNKGELKICDFGMARQYGSPLKPYTALVVTLWYRAPELLLGAKEYSTAVDMWSVGCIMAELLTGKPLFDGKTELEQLNKIFRTLGTPNDKIWPGCSQLPGVKANLAHQPYSILHTKFPRASFTGSPTLSDSGLDLLSKLLTYDPAKRITAEEALNHRWFKEVPLPQTKDFMPTFPVGKVTLAR